MGALLARVGDGPVAATAACPSWRFYVRRPQSPMVWPVLGPRWPARPPRAEDGTGPRSGLFAVPGTLAVGVRHPEHVHAAPGDDDDRLALAHEMVGDVPAIARHGRLDEVHGRPARQAEHGDRRATLTFSAGGLIDGAEVIEDGIC